MPVMQQPEIYLGNAHELFDENGKAIKTSEEYFTQVIYAYTDWVYKSWTKNN